VLAKYILGALAICFLAAALIRMSRGEGHPQTRAWLLIALMFGVVSAWLFLS
jgi:hypothetical protein